MMGTLAQEMWTTEQLNPSARFRYIVGRRANSKNRYHEVAVAFGSPPAVSNAQVEEHARVLSRNVLQTPASTGSSPDHGIQVLAVSQLHIADDEGFLPVKNRKRKIKYKENDTPDIPPSNVTTLLPQNLANPTIIDLVTPRGSDTVPVTVDLRTPPKTPRTHFDRITIFSELLNDRIHEVMLDVNRRAYEMNDKYAKCS